MLVKQIFLTRLNSKSEPADDLEAEILRKFHREDPEAIEWVFDAWREQSPFFPSISDIRKLLFDYRRGVREQEELKARMDEKLLLEERRQQGQVVEYGEVLKQLREIAAKVPELPVRKPQMSSRMIGLMQIAPTLNLSEDQIRARRERERAECERYRSHAENE
jgi:hypothetical protein